MIAIDTNLVIRLITGDDPHQVKIARDVLDRNDVFVSFGVLMESEWVLRSQYQYSRSEIGNALHAFIRLESVKISDREGVRWALDRYDAGADFADMLHLVDHGGAEEFATFDKNILKQSGPEAPIPILTL